MVLKANTTFFASARLKRLRWSESFWGVNGCENTPDVARGGRGEGRDFLQSDASAAEGGETVGIMASNHIRKPVY